MSGSLTGLITHTRRIQIVYKKALRSLEDWYDRREVYRYHAVLMRQRFEEVVSVNDPRIAKDMLSKIEAELFENQHWHPRKFPESPGGVAYGREVIPPDWVVDHWHPLEKAQYPEYFARREERKKEYVKHWAQKYGTSSYVPH
ncbi:unnamed protein product [Phaedon cochleariae]|uniref:NADH dehydrogenase [ubiquinone] 1 beta subcomplex subunit 9 n=1 Tax=Phaedon cochleariae TaxID=80249 RepID=A0A9P0DLV0_PHACE|nr:unnamed protein product [Phaedon cochleariae]